MQFLRLKLSKENPKIICLTQIVKQYKKPFDT